MNRDDSIRSILEKSFPQLNADQVGKLVAYYEFVMKWNKRISLTTITSEAEFAERHLGEAIFATGCVLEGLDEFWDIGTGLGIPGIPAAILRTDMDVRLVESNRKKAIFLEEAVEALGLERVTILNHRFEGLEGFSVRSCIAARAVDRMSDVVRLVIKKGASAGQLLIFGGGELDVVCPVGKEMRTHLLPGSTDRFIFEIF